MIKIVIACYMIFQMQGIKTECKMNFSPVGCPTGIKKDGAGLLKYQSPKKNRRINKLPIIAIICVVIAAIAVVALLTSIGMIPTKLFPFGSPSRATAHSSTAASSIQSSSDTLSSVASDELPSDSEYSSDSSTISTSASSTTSSKTGTAAASVGTGSLLMLVNKSTPIPSGYTPALTTVNIKYYTSTSKDNHFDTRAASYLSDMIQAASKDGITLRIVSGYRSHAYQVSNYNAKVNEYIAKGESKEKAQADAATVVAPPGTSEHETGLSCDIISSDWYTKHSELDDTFDQTKEYAWLSSHAAQYGFILRYPKGKESVTQYTYEPWHYRFVGTANASKIKASGLCLEEYLQKHPNG